MFLFNLNAKWTCSSLLCIIAAGTSEQLVGSDDATALVRACTGKLHALGITSCGKQRCVFCTVTSICVDCVQAEWRRLWAQPTAYPYSKCA